MASDFVFIPAGAGERQAILGSAHTNKVTPLDSRGAFAATELSVPPRGGAPMHRHARDAEFLYVLEGELTFEHPDGAVTARAGDCCYLPAGGAHAFRNDGDARARALVIVSPGIEADRFFSEVDARGITPDTAALLPEIAGRNGISFV